MNNIIHVALAIWDPKGTYSRHAGATIVSILKNTKSKVCFHILHDKTLNTENKEKLISTTEKFGGEISFFDVTNEINKLSSLNVEKITGTFSPGSVFRLFLPNFELDKIIYSDCDVIANMDIKELWDVPTEDFYIIGVKEITMEEEIGKRKFKNLYISNIRLNFMKIPYDKYFNSGLSVLNLKKIREDFDLIGEAVRFFSRHEKCATSPDQDLLNKLFNKNCLLVDKKFNFPTNLSVDGSESALFHFVGVKPWVFHSGNPVEALYWECLAASAWGDKLIEYMLETNGKNLIHLHSKDCLKKLLTGIIRDITRYPAKLLTWTYGDIKYRLGHLLKGRNSQT